MSKFMINDEALINDINPFVEFDFSLPGAWSKPPQYGVLSRQTQDKETDSDPTSPICNFGITAGDRTVDMCRRPPENCPLNRMWEPQRLWDPEFYVPPVVQSAPIPTVSTFAKELVHILVVLLVLYAILDMTRK
jgi:hypothetical protein